MPNVNLSPRGAMVFVDGQNYAPAPQFQAGAQNITPTGTTATTALQALKAGQKFWRISSDTAIYYKLGTDDTVSISSDGEYLAAGAVEYIPVGSWTHIALILSA